MKRSLLLLLLALLLTACTTAGVAIIEEFLPLPQVELIPEDRILVLAPHPDDEILGAGGLIQEVVALGLPVHITWMTYGDYNEWSFILYRKRPNLTPAQVRQMGDIRRQEAIAAAAQLGVSEENLSFLGYPDFGTLNIWYRHWDEERPPLRSRLTRVRAVPYATAFRPGAPHKGEEILSDLTTILRQTRPTRIFVSHPADHHPDHQALYLYLQVALWNLADELRADVYPYLIHYPAWPQPPGLRPEEELRPPIDLLKADWQRFLLTPGQIEAKHEALRAHATQYRSGGRKLRAFIRVNELFGDYPTVLLTEGRVVEQEEESKATEIPEELTEAEAADFVGVEEEVVRLDGDELVISVRLSRPLLGPVAVSIYAFGYSNEVPFPQMPKLRFVFRGRSYTVYDQQRKRSAESVTVSRQPTHIEVCIPRTLLADPGRVLVSARSTRGSVPLDWLAWRSIALPRPH